VNFRSFAGLGELGELQLLTVSACPAVLSLPNLASALQLESIVVERCSALAALPGLDSPRRPFSLTLKDSLAISNLGPIGSAPDLERLYLLNIPGFTSLAGAFNLSGLTRITIENLPDLGGLNGFAATPALRSMRIHGCPMFASLAGAADLGDTLALELSNLPALTSLAKLGADAIDLRVEYCDALVDLNGLGPEDSVRQLVLNQNDGLRGLGSLPVATDCDLIHLHGNPLLADLGALAGVIRAERLYLGLNASLISLDGLAALEEVTGDLVITNNTALDQCVAETFAAGISVGGNTTVEGNGPCQ
jgi:hypothetical protein